MIDVNQRFSNNLKCAVAGLVTASIAVATASAGDPPQKVSIPSSSDSFSFSNSPTYTPVATGFSEVDNPKLKAMENLKGASSLDAIFHLPEESPLQPSLFQPPQLSPRRNLPGYDRQKNWAFADLDDPLQLRTGDQQFVPRKTDMFGRDESQLSLVEMYFQNSGRKPLDASKDNKDPNKQAVAKFKGENLDFDPVTSALKGSDGFFRKMVTGDDEPGVKLVPARQITGNGPGAFGMSPEEREQMRRVAVFRHQLDPSYPLPKVENPLGLVDMGNQAPAPALAAPASASILQRNLNPTAGPVDPNIKAFHSRVYDDPTATALGLPQKSPFQVDKPAPPQPTAQSALSQIDPFSANLPKRKF